MGLGGLAWGSGACLGGWGPGDAGFCGCGCLDDACDYGRCGCTDERGEGAPSTSGGGVAFLSAASGVTACVLAEELCWLVQRRPLWLWVLGGGHWPMWLCTAITALSEFEGPSCAEQSSWFSGTAVALASSSGISGLVGFNCRVVCSLNCFYIPNPYTCRFNFRYLRRRLD
jgi:hypothetical protein